MTVWVDRILRVKSNSWDSSKTTYYDYFVHVSDTGELTEENRISDFNGSDTNQEPYAIEYAEKIGRLTGNDVKLAWMENRINYMVTMHARIVASDKDDAIDKFRLRYNIPLCVRLTAAEG